jgi:hypothetical protein
VNLPISLFSGAQRLISFWFAVLFHVGLFADMYHICYCSLALNRQSRKSVIRNAVMAHDGLAPDGADRDTLRLYNTGTETDSGNLAIAK